MTETRRSDWGEEEEEEEEEEEGISRYSFQYLVPPDIDCSVSTLG